MSIWMFWKLFGDACLYFSAVGAFPVLFAHDFSLLIPALLCGLGGAAASLLANRGRDRLAWLCILIPAASLYLASETIEYVILLPLLIYVAAVILRGEFFLDYLNFREFFRKCILIWSIGFGLLCIASAVEIIARPINTTISYDETLWMGVFYMVSSVILQRQLRMGVDAAGSDRRLNGLQSAAVLGGTGGILLCVWGLERAFAEQTQEFMNKLGELLLYICTLPLALIVWLVGPLFEDIQEQIEETHNTETTESTAEHIATFFEGEPTLPQQTVQESSGFPWWFVVLVLSLLLIFLLTVLKLYSGKREAVRSATAFANVEQPEEKRSRSRAGNRARVRRYYREHLKLEKRKGQKLLSNQTSADILAGISPSTDTDAATALRNVYLKARYDDNATITNDDVRLAKNAMKQLR